MPSSSCRAGVLALVFGFCCFVVIHETEGLYFERIEQLLV
jgi:hypothetical protein